MWGLVTRIIRKNSYCATVWNTVLKNAKYSQQSDGVRRSECGALISFCLVIFLPSSLLQYEAWSALGDWVPCQIQQTLSVLVLGWLVLIKKKKKTSCWWERISMNQHQARSANSSSLLYRWRTKPFCVILCRLKAAMNLFFAWNHLQYHPKVCGVSKIFFTNFYLARMLSNATKVYFK